MRAHYVSLKKKNRVQYPTKRRNEKQYTRSVYYTDGLRVFSKAVPPAVFHHIVWYSTKTLGGNHSTQANDF